MSNNGLSQVTRWLGQMSSKLESDIKQAVKETGESVENQAVALVPVDTAMLKGSIRLELQDGGFTADVSANTEYARAVEFGTSTQRAQPYMTPAFNQHNEVFRRKLQEVAERIGD